MMAHGEDYNKRWKEEDLSNNKDLLRVFTSQSPLNIAYRYYGTGDIGGSPTLESVRAVKGVKGSGPVEIISATSDQYIRTFQPYGNHPELTI